MKRTAPRQLCWLLILLVAAPILSACGGPASLYVPDLLANAGQYNGKDITVQGAYLQRNGESVLALGVSTLDNGLDAQALGDQIWVDGFPGDVTNALHRPGDSIYGFVKVSGHFETGGKYGPNGQFSHRLTVTQAEAIERVRRNEVRIGNQALGEGKVTFAELNANAAKYNGQTVTTQGYYFWNSVIYVLAEGVSPEDDGSNPQPIGQTIWLEGFPPDQSGQLNLGPGNPPAFVWGLVEVTGSFQSGGAFGKDGAYSSILQVQSARAIK
jgi:hypothetical protein